MSRIVFLLFSIAFFLILSCTLKKKSDLNISAFDSKEYKSMSSLKKAKYLDSISSTHNLLTNDSIHRNFLFKLSTEYYYLNNYPKSLKISTLVLKLSEDKRDTLSIARANFYIGDCYEENQKDSAYYYYRKAEKFYRAINNNEKIGLTLFKKASLLFFEGNYVESEIELSESLFYLKNSSNNEILISAYTLMGLNFEKLEEYDNALKYQLLSREFFKDLKKSNLTNEKQLNCSVAAAVNLSNIYEKTFQYKKSIKELNSVLSPDLKKQFPTGYATVIGNLGYSKMKSGDLKGVENLMKEALMISKQNRSETIILYKLINLGEYYSVAKDTVQSILYLKQSLQLAEKIKAGEEIKRSLNLLSKVDFRYASKYDKRYIAISDSLTKAQRINRNKYARIEYETSVLALENEVLSSKISTVITGALLLSLGLGFIIIYRYFKSQKREIQFRIQQQHAEEEVFDLLKTHQLKLSETKIVKQNRIAMELHDHILNKLYGTRIQLGILNNSDAEKVKEKRESHIDMLQEIEIEIRDISHELHTDSIETHFDYTSLLNKLIREQNELGSTLFKFESDASIDWERIKGLEKISIYRIIQEALLNVNKYAAAKTCRIVISKLETGKMELLIWDDGIGFDTNTAEKEGIGLKNIQERARLVGAKLTITSGLGSGTSIKVVFTNSPLKNN